MSLAPRDVGRAAPGSWLASTIWAPNTGILIGGMIFDSEGVFDESCCLDEENCKAEQWTNLVHPFCPACRPQPVTTLDVCFHPHDELNPRCIEPPPLQGRETRLCSRHPRDGSSRRCRSVGGASLIPFSMPDSTVSTLRQVRLTPHPVSAHVPNSGGNGIVCLNIAAWQSVMTNTTAPLHLGYTSGSPQRSCSVTFGTSEPFQSRDFGEVARQILPFPVSAACRTWSRPHNLTPRSQSAANASTSTSYTVNCLASHDITSRPRRAGTGHRLDA